MEQEPNKELLFEELSLRDATVSILLVEDNAGDVVLIREILKTTGIDFSLKHVSTLKETLLLCVESNFDVILLDLGLSDSTGLETLKKIQLFNVKSPVVVMTGLDDEDIALESLREGAQDYIVKSRLNADNILRAIKYGIERKKIQDLLRKNARQFSLLSSTTTAINECEEISPIFTLTCRNISMLLDKAGTIAVDMTYPGKVYASGTEIIKPWYDQIKTNTGFNLNNPALHANDLKLDFLDLFTDGKLHKMTIVNDPSKTVTRTRKTSGTENLREINIYAIGFVKSSIVYGGALIFAPDVISADDINVIESVCNQVSLSLNRKIIEQDLKSSKDKYRKLSKELEIKVSERTRDLEMLNYQLNQELIERHQAEEALKKSEVRLKELNATKDKFFNIIAHDLKNPFTCLLGSTELLNENIGQMDTENIRKLVQILNDSAKSGYAILQNLLDWSRSQTGLITFKPEKIDLKKIIDENIADYRLPSEKKQIQMVSGVKEHMFIIADKNMINTILRNLLGNALKFTQRSGTIRIAASVKENEVTVSVKDTGIGIPEENISKLFRIDTKYTRPGTDLEQGTGLGLKLSREFVEMQGGKIWVKSTVNKGSEFIFTIPVKET